MRLAAVVGALVISAGIASAATRSTHSPAAVVWSAVWRAAIARSGVQHFEYVFPDGQMFVYDIDHGFKLVKRVSLPTGDGVRGVAVSAATHTLYVSHGSDGAAATVRCSPSTC